MPPSNAQLEQYRDPDEGEDQWAVKRAFLEKNWDSFPEERRQKLITLMHCFHNMHVWGCSYPPKVMAEVKRLAEGLSTSKPKVVRKPQIVKINFVAATPVSNKFSTLNEESETGVLLDDSPEAAIDPNDAPCDKPKQRRRKNKKEKAVQKTDTTEIETNVDEVEAMSPPRCGFGFKSNTTNISTSKASPSKASLNFVFGKKNDYAKRLGFVKSSESNQGFEFGKPIPVSQKSVGESGTFQFGVDSKTPERTTAGTFTFGKVRKERLRSSEDLQQRFENASLLDSDSNPRNKTVDPGTSNGTERFGTLASLEALRAALRKVRPPLADSRVEFVMLQVNLASQGKVETVKTGDETHLLYGGVLVASGSSEAAAYEELRERIVSPEQWHVSSKGPELVLELGNALGSPSPPKRRPSDVAVDACLAVATPRSQTLTETGRNDNFSATRRNDEFSKTADRNEVAMSFASKNSNAVSQSFSNSNPQNAQAPLSNNAQQGILQNLERLRKTLATAKFKSRIEMLGGFEKDPISALNIAFQIAILKPVRDAVVASTGCRFRFFSSAANKQHCTASAHGVSLCTASASSNREAKKLAARNVLNTLQSGGRFCIVFENGENRLVTSGQPTLRPGRPNAEPEPIPEIVPETARRSKLESYDADGFFLVRLANNDQDPASILDRSSHANDFSPPVYTYAVEGSVHLCLLRLSGKQILEFEGRGETKKLSKDDAVRAALNSLIAHCPTILVNSMAHDAKEFVKDAMELGTESRCVVDGLNRRLNQDNVGFQLLEKMGWSGGGLGCGGGLIEPIMLKDNSGNHGLGYARSGEPDKRFLGNIRSTLRAFLRESDVFQELKFSPTFSNVERKHIHTIARQLGLKSKSSTRPEGRVLCVSHSIDWRMILDSLRRQGGAVGKFELLGPGSWSPPEGVRQKKSVS